MSSSCSDDEQFSELLGLALLEGTIEERTVAVLNYVRVNVLDDCEAVLLSRDQFDFEAQRLRLGKIKGAVRAGIDASIYGLLREPKFLERINEAFPEWADTIVREYEESSIFWMCDTSARAGVDVAKWRNEQLYPVGLEDVWGATAYIGAGDFLTVLIPLHRGGKCPSPEQMHFILRLPAVLAPVLTSKTSSKPLPELEESLRDGLSDAQGRVLSYALSGLSEKEIAHRLHRSPHTISSHLRVIYRHFRVSSRAELLALAIDRNRPKR